MVHMEEDRSQHRGNSPTLFEKRVSSLKSLVTIGLVKDERLGQRLNVPTQGCNSYNIYLLVLCDHPGEGICQVTVL